MGNTQYKTFEDNKHSVDDKIWLLERYLFAMDKPTFFSSLVYGSELYKYMRYSDYLNNPQDYDREALEREMFAYLVKIDNCLQDEILFKKLARDACEAKSTEERKAILMRINSEYFSLNFDQWAPTVPVPVERTNDKSDQSQKSSKPDLSTTEEPLRALDLEQHLSEIENLIINHEDYKLDSYQIAVAKFTGWVAETPEYFLSKLSITKLLSSGGAFKVSIVLSTISKSPEAQFYLAKITNLEEGILALHNQNCSPKNKGSKAAYSQVNLQEILVHLPAEILRSLAKTNLNQSQEFWLAYVRKMRLAEDIPNQEIPSFLPKEWNTAIAYCNLLWKLEKQANMDDFLGWLSHPYLSLEPSKIPGLMLTKYSSKHFNDQDLTEIKQAIRAKSFLSASQQFTKSLKDILSASDLTQIIYLKDQLAQHCGGSQYHTKNVAQICIDLGKTYPNMNQEFSEHELAELRHKKMLRWVDDSNCKKVNSPADAKLKVELCGIKSLSLVIYSIDLKSNFLLTGSSSVTFGTELQGYRPLAQENFPFNPSSGQILEHTFELHNFIKKLGTYVVEISGEGLAVKAELKVGNLALAPLPWTYDSADDQFLLLDQDGVALVGQITLLDSSTIFRADPDTKIVMIPKKDRTSARYSEPILVESDSGAAAITQLLCYPPTPRLDAELIRFPGRLQPGTLATLILAPFLTHEPVSTERINLPKGTQLRLSIKATNDQNQTQTSTRAVEVQQDGLATLEYFVSDGISRVEISMSYEDCRLENRVVQGSSNLQLSVAKLGELCFDRHFFNLRITAEHFVVCIHGKNGETYPEKPVSVLLESLLSKGPRRATIQTNADGQLKIPRDPSIVKIEVSTHLCDKLIKQDWSVNHWNQSWPPQINLVEGQNFYLPSDCTSAPLPREMRSFILFKSEENGDLTEISIPNVDGEPLKIPTLNPGPYEFVYTLRNMRGTIAVYPKSSASKHLLKDEDCQDFKQATDPIRIGCNTEINKDRVVQSTIHLKATSGTPKAFMILSNTYSPHKPTESVEHGEVVSLLVDRGVAYLSKNSESAEVKYAKTRRQANETRVGSTLSKPSTLLNRKKEKVTEPLKPDSEDNIKHNEHAGMAEKKSRMAKGKPASVLGEGGEVGSSSSDWRVWLAHPGKVIPLIVTKNAQNSLGGGYATYRTELRVPESYQHGQIVWITSQGSHASELLALQSGDFLPERTKHELLANRPANKIEFEQQTISVTKDHMPDTKTSKTVATCQDLFSVLCYLNSSAAAELRNWDFLAVWPLLSIQSQLVLYDKYASHELHIFLYFKDKEFTEEVVKPHLRNKNKKQFVDYFILEDSQMLKQYLTPFGIAHLDFKSKILLMFHFHSKEPQICYNYVQKLKKQLPELSPAEQDALKEKFDSIVGTEFEQVAITDKYSKKEFIDSFESQRSHAVLKTEYVPQMSGNVSAFNTMGETNEVVDQSWSFPRSSVSASRFWISVLDSMLSGTKIDQILSREFLHITDQPVEIILALALTGLPFSNPVIADGSSNSQRSQPSYLLSRQKISHSVETEQSSNLLVSQKFFKVANSPGMQVQTEEKDYLRLQTTYALKTVVINGEDKSVKATLSVQVPKGALPLAKTQESQNITLEVGPFKTFEHIQHFYFPESSEIYHQVEMYPATVFADNKIISQAHSVKITQGPQKKVDLNKMLDMFDKQGADEVLDINFSAIYSKLKDFEVYQKTLTILRRRFEFDQTVWSFSLYHGDLETAREWFSNRFANDAIRLHQFDIFYLRNDLIDVNFFNFREYSPLTNPRIHDISQYKHNIINRDFLNTYYILLKYFQDKGSFDEKDNISLCVYLLSQDRIDQALEIFKKIDPKRVKSEMKIQFDYLDCYLGFQTKQFTHILEVAKSYLLYPVLSWRKLFEDVVRQVLLLQEITQDRPDEQMQSQQEHEPNAAGQSKVRVLDTDTAFDAELVEGSQLDIFSYKLNQVRVDYYSVDLELLVASNPSILEDRASDAQIAVFPNYSELVTINQTQPEQSLEAVETQTTNPSPKINTTHYKIHNDFINKDTLIRVASGNKSKTLWNTSTALRVHTIESHGLVKVSSLRSPLGLAGCYVKCLAQKTTNSGQFKFFKDGYTDIRGYFDYASLGGTDNFRDVQIFALLVVSKDEGSKFLKVHPPTESVRPTHKEFQVPLVQPLSA